MNKTATPWYAIRRKTAVAAAAIGALAAAEILIYGDIGESWWDETTSAKSFMQELANLDVDAITVRINSMGGSVPDGIAIYNAMKRHKATITVEVDGIAYSIASLIAMGGDTVNMASNALMMIHAPWTYAAGNSAELREQADQLDTWATAMSTSYAAKTGDQPGALALLMDGKDHFFTAEEALSLKFIDAITDANPVAASAARALPVSRYRSLPAAQAASEGISAAAAATSADEESMNKIRNHVLMSAVGAAGAMAGGGGSAAAPAATAPVVDAAAVLAADQERRNGIAASFKPFADRAGVGELMARLQNDHAITVEAAGAQLLAHMAAGATSVAGAHVVSTVEDEHDKHRRAAEGALLARAGLAKAEGANPFRGYTLSEMARASLARGGFKSEGMDKMQFIGAAFTHSTSDFTGLLANVANKALLAGYEEAEETFQQWTRPGSLPDFKPGSRVDLNMFPSLRKVAEGAEYKYATVGERGAQVVLATYGELFSITRQAIINDDLDAFTRVPRMMGRAAIRTIGDLVYAILTANPNMPDGTPLFHADHKNLLAGGGITTAAVDAMQSAMALQKQGQSVLNIAMQYLIVPRALKGTANVVRASEYEVGAAKNNTVPNSVRDTFEVISDARLDAASATAWYGAGNPSVHDTIEVSYLDGNQAPYLEQRQGWNVDGTEFKVRIDAGVSPLGFRALAKNPGA